MTDFKRHGLKRQGAGLRARLHRFYGRGRGLLLHAHPRHARDTVKKILARLGLLPTFWRLRARKRRLQRALEPRRLAVTWRWMRRQRAAVVARRHEPRLTVAVDISAFWEPLTGIGWYLYRLLEHLAARQDLRLRLYGPNLIDTPDLLQPVVVLPQGPAIEVVAYRVPKYLSLDYVRVVGWLRNREARLIAADHNTLLFAPNYFLPKAFRYARGRLVATVHDLGFQRVPWTLRESTRGDLAAHLARTLDRAVAVLTDSETVRGELIESGLVKPSRVRAVHLGPGASVETGANIESSAAMENGAALGLPPGTPPRYALHVGTVEPRKSLPTLLAAWRLLRARGAAPPPLVLCGGFGWKAETLRAEIEAAAAEGWLHHFGYLDDGAVAALYRGADLVALPSIYEGFGLPAVEAMAAGVPLVASDIPVLREVAADAALFVPPEQPEAWAETLGRLLADEALGRDMGRRGRARSRAFDWRRTAEETAAAWLEAAGRGAAEKVD